MNDKARALLEAQVRFTLKSYRGKSLNRLIANTVDTFFEHFESVSINQLIDQQLLADIARETLLEQGANAELLDMIRNLLLGSLEMDLLRKYAVKDVLSKKSYDLVVDRIVGSETIRNKTIGRTTESDVYAELISDVLYNGIKDYLLDENFLVRFKGVSTLIKAGKWGINKSMPRLDESVESTTKSYIQTNARRTIGLSKSFLERELDDQRIKSISNGLWKKLRTKKLSSLTSHIDESTLESLIGDAEQIWEHVRQQDFTGDLCSALIGLWFESYGERSAVSLLDAIDMDRNTLISKIQAVAPSIVQQAEATGFLEARIRAQLTPFYSSKEVAKILDA